MRLYCTTRMETGNEAILRVNRMDERNEATEMEPGNETIDWSLGMGVEYSLENGNELEPGNGATVLFGDWE